MKTATTRKKLRHCAVLAVLARKLALLIGVGPDWASCQYRDRGRCNNRKRLGAEVSGRLTLARINSHILPKQLATQLRHAINIPSADHLVAGTTGQFPPHRQKQDPEVENERPGLDV